MTWRTYWTHLRGKRCYERHFFDLDQEQRKMDRNWQEGVERDGNPLKVIKEQSKETSNVRLENIPSERLQESHKTPTASRKRKKNAPASTNTVFASPKTSRTEIKTSSRSRRTRESRELTRTLYITSPGDKILVEKIANNPCKQGVSDTQQQHGVYEANSEWDSLTANTCKIDECHRERCYEDKRKGDGLNASLQPLRLRRHLRRDNSPWENNARRHKFDPNFIK